MPITFEQVWRLKPLMIQWARQNGANRDNAEDIVQDVFLKLLDLIEKRGGMEWLEYNSAPSVRYLQLMVRSVTMDRYKAEKNQIYHEFIPDIDTPTDEESDLDTLYLTESLLQVFCDSFHSLHWYNYQLAYLYFFEGYSLRQLEAETGINMYSIHKTISNVKEFLKTEATRHHETWEAHICKDDPRTHFDIRKHEPRAIIINL